MEPGWLIVFLLILVLIQVARNNRRHRRRQYIPDFVLDIADEYINRRGPNGPFTLYLYIVGVLIVFVIFLILVVSFLLSLVS